MSTPPAKAYNTNAIKAMKTRLAPFVDSLDEPCSLGGPLASVDASYGI